MTVLNDHEQKDIVALLMNENLKSAMTEHALEIIYGSENYPGTGVRGDIDIV